MSVLNPFAGGPSSAGTGPPRFHCTGPVDIWVRFPTSTSIDVGSPHSGSPGHVAKLDYKVRTITPSTGGKAYHLGTCEQFPTQEEEVPYLPIYDNLSMSASPRDKEYAGSKELVVLPLNRFNYNVLNFLLAYPRHGRKDAKGIMNPPGQNNHMDRGSLLLGKVQYFELWLLNTFYGTRIWNNFSDMPGGTYYPFCNIAANNTPKQGAGRTQIRMIAVEANWNYLPIEGRWLLKSTADAELARIKG